MARLLEEQWCAAPRSAGVPYRSFSFEGGPAALLGVANREQAELVVVGRSGRSGLSEPAPRKLQPPRRASLVGSGRGDTGGE
jgi:hypothetical protein